MVDDMEGEWWMIWREVVDDMEGSGGPYLSTLPLHIFHHSLSISSTTLPPYLSPLPLHTFHHSEVLFGT